MRRAPVPRLAHAAGPSKIDSLCRSIASTSLRGNGPELNKQATSTYSAILASLSDSLDSTEPSQRPPRSAAPRRNTREDLEAAWATRPVYGDPNWPATPYTGRSVALTPANDVNRAFQQLSSLLARNSVRRELKLGDRYEKPNRERNRKKSERHRRRFADMVRRKVQLVSVSCAGDYSDFMLTLCFVYLLGLGHQESRRIVPRLYLAVLSKSKTQSMCMWLKNIRAGRYSSASRSIRLNLGPRWVGEQGWVVNMKVAGS